MADSYILTRLNAIESEVAEVRRQLAREADAGKRSTSLFGILGEVEFTEEEIDAVIASSFRDPNGQK